MDSSKVASPAPGIIINQQSENVLPQNTPSVNNPSANNPTGPATGLSEVDQTDLIHIVKILQKYNFKVMNIATVFKFFTT